MMFTRDAIREQEKLVDRLTSRLVTCPLNDYKFVKDSLQAEQTVLKQMKEAQ